MQRGRKLWAIAAALVFALSVLSCCSAIDMASFRAADLQRQIEWYQHMHRRNCLGHHGTRYLTTIGERGAPAAEAMIPFLEQDDDAFPPSSAMVVISGAEAVTSLRGQPVEAALERFAQTGKREGDRKLALLILGYVRDPSRHAR